MRENMDFICIFGAMMLTIFVLSGCATKLQEGLDQRGVIFHTCFGLCQFGMVVDEADGTMTRGQFPTNEMTEDMTEGAGQ